MANSALCFTEFYNGKDLKTSGHVVVRGWIGKGKGQIATKMILDDTTLFKMVERNGFPEQMNSNSQNKIKIAILAVK